MRRWAIAIALVLFALPLTGQTGSDSQQYTTGLFHNCPPEGDGRGDVTLNRLKNRDKPPPQYRTVGMTELIKAEPSEVVAMGAKHRERWTSEAKETVAQFENTGVTVEGILVFVKQAEPESCNCHDPTMRDLHVCLSATATVKKSQMVICEVSPRTLPAHPNWRLRILKQLAKDQPRVRISGWLMWDNEHPAMLGKTRATLWEIHPIHRIEVFSAGQWRDL